ncbi:rRNA maturation RNase YbeY [Mucilaginibacter sp. PPCGB 2223]|uniref:rRNA maturation RNase YbeY n=1 Tax=Mucilaginibacter sp. PPCGB 2223 TaxID=1886027 RepID=UPI00082495A6|nr:rRNA maturation RNase YbeY [Mucilaginibacter sp. PPCGB 2223]OCX50442.1 rRNA maturation RNase YbeY [Mucilaginibacter sp. PPCGB 2223]
MPRIPVFFFEEDIKFKPKNKTALRGWIKDTIVAEGYKLKELNYIFCSDKYLIGINRQYLDHDTYTDIITFDHSEKEKMIGGDIFISIERIRENAAKFSVSEANELHRVIIHGALHLLGYRDKSKADKALMTAKEDFYLAQVKF